MTLTFGMLIWRKECWILLNCQTYFLHCNFAQGFNNTVAWFVQSLQYFLRIKMAQINSAFVHKLSLRHLLVLYVI